MGRPRKSPPAQDGPAPSPARKPRRPGPAKLLRTIHGALSLDLLHPDYAPDAEQVYFANLGQCYVATEALYHLWAKEAGYVPHVLNHGAGTHWWLVHSESGEVLDPTEPQLGGEPFPYHRGRRATFLTQKPSKRAAELIRRVQVALQG